MRECSPAKRAYTESGGKERRKEHTEFVRGWREKVVIGREGARREPACREEREEAALPSSSLMRQQKCLL